MVEITCQSTPAPLCAAFGAASTGQQADLLPVSMLGLGDPQRRESFVSKITEVVNTWSDSALGIADKRGKTDQLLRTVVSEYCDEVGFLPVMTSVVGEQDYAEQGLAFKLKNWGIQADWASLMLRPRSEFCAQLIQELRKAEVAAIIVGQCWSQPKSVPEKRADIFKMLIPSRSHLQSIADKSCRLTAQAMPFNFDLSDASAAFDPESEDSGVEKCLQLTDGTINREDVIDTYLAPINASLIANFFALKTQLGLGESIKTGFLKGAMLLPSDEKTVYCQPNPHCEMANLYVKISSLVPSTETLCRTLENNRSALAEQQLRFVVDEKPNGKMDLWLVQCLHLPTHTLDDTTMHALAENIRRTAKEFVATSIHVLTSM